MIVEGTCVFYMVSIITQIECNVTSYLQLTRRNLCRVTAEAETLSHQRFRITAAQSGKSMPSTNAINLSLLFMVVHAAILGRWA